MRRLATFACAALAFAASAFHVQVGVTGYSNFLATYANNGRLISPATPWFSTSNEIGRVAERLDGFAIGRCGSSLSFVPYSTTQGDGNISTCIAWNDRNDMSLIGVGISLTGEKTQVAMGEAVYVGEFGGGFWPVANGVLTMRGDPFSTVMNDTSQDRVINGVSIRAGESAALLFPVYITTEEIPNVSFSDLDSGDSISAYATDQGNIYYNGAYMLAWTGNIRISDGTSATNAPDENLVFGDMVSANEDKVLYATNGMPIRSAIVVVHTNLMLNTWWDFDQDAWGSPKAMINGEVVCGGHRTSHIVSYAVFEDIEVNMLTGDGRAEFTMSQTPSSGHSGGSCTMRCWDAHVDSYSAAPEDHKAEVAAGLGIARFRITVNIYSGKWKVEPL